MILDGKKAALAIEKELAADIKRLAGRPPTLVVFLVGSHPASEVYVRNKQRACQRVGIHSVLERRADTISYEAMIQEVEACNRNPAVDGILIQLPLPSHILARDLMEVVSPEKDVDGFHPLNLGKLLEGRRDGFVACTPLGVRVLLHRYKISTEGRHVVILGRSEIVGKPLAALLLQKSSWGNATVSIAHRQTENLAALTKQADILIAAMGSPRFVKASMIKKGVVAVDVGTTPETNFEGEKRMVGDIDFEQVSPLCHAISPVPGGVGPMTVAMLLANTWKSYCLREKIDAPDRIYPH